MQLGNEQVVSTNMCVCIYLCWVVCVCVSECVCTHPGKIYLDCSEVRKPSAVGEPFCGGGPGLYNWRQSCTAKAWLRSTLLPDCTCAVTSSLNCQGNKTFFPRAYFCLGILSQQQEREQRYPSLTLLFASGLCSRDVSSYTGKGGSFEMSSLLR